MAAILPHAERPLRHAHKSGRFSGGEPQLAASRTQLRRQRVSLLAAKFGFSRPQRNPNARYQKGYGTQTLRVYGDTAVVTARLWLKGANPDGTGAFDRKLWFSDTYVRTPAGWRYAFGQASTALPAP